MFPGSNPREWRRSSPHPPLAFTSSSPGAFETASAETVARCPSFVTFWDDTVEGWPRAMVERPSAEIRLELIEARLRAQEVAFKAISSIDPGSGRAVLLALEVLELEQLELTGEEDETLRYLRRFREQMEELRLLRRNTIQ